MTNKEHLSVARYAKVKAKDKHITEAQRKLYLEIAKRQERKAKSETA